MADLLLTKGELAGAAVAYRCLLELYKTKLLARIMHHVEHFARLSGGSRAGNPSGWIGVRLLAVQRVWD